MVSFRLFFGSKIEYTFSTEVVKEDVADAVMMNMVKYSKDEENFKKYIVP